MKGLGLILFFLCNFNSPIFQKVDINCSIKSKMQAIKLAEKEFFKAYGSDILLMKPFTAKLINNKVWRVKGTKPNDILGGVPYIEIQ